ncbi:MAG: hypothetical protein OES13_03400 [Acidimicrobiia bacterium]|nr:hypothetical protein [Acidimicrobiia bacterium]
MAVQKSFTTSEAREIAQRIGINFAEEAFEIEEFRLGLSVELEHGLVDERTNVTDDDYEVTGKIAWAHLDEISDYYTRLTAMEAQAHRK